MKDESYGIDIQNVVFGSCCICDEYMRGRANIHIQDGEMYCNKCFAELEQDLTTDIQSLTKAINKLCDILDTSEDNYIKLKK